ncbi:hypothetical protein EDD22DRAFT_844828 [Suillus occidentalis]|nr:hypothetical protein EDD22DRAFT_844828 [Suillus occidentalis]
MTSQWVHFVLPTGTSGGDHKPSTGECGNNARRTKALAEWWGDFVPLEHWNLPRVAHRFPEWGYKRYNMSPEVRIDTMNDHGDSTPDKYNHAYSGRDESITELSAGPSYDFRWNTDPSRSETPPASDNESYVSCLTALSGPAYDLGWGSQAPKGGPDDTMSGHDDSATYDLGWGSAAPTNPSAPTAVPETSVNDDLVYNLGWGHTFSADTCAPTAQLDTEPSDAQIPALNVGMEGGNLGDDKDDGPAYDLGWGNAHPEEEPMDGDDDDVAVIKLEAKEEIVHDVTQSNDVIDLTCSASPERIRAHRLSPAVTKPESASGDEQLMFRANRRLKAISNDMMDQHMHAIVKNAVYGLNAEQLPGQILLENRQLKLDHQHWARHVQTSPAHPTSAGIDENGQQCN